MTLIVVDSGLVLADSNRASFAEGKFQQTGKITPYDKPIRKYSKALGIEDVFVGFSGTGNDEVIEYAGNSLNNDLTLDAWKECYRYVDQLRFINSITTCAIMLFGMRGTLFLNVVSGEVTMTYEPYNDFKFVSMGSGQAAYKRLRTELGDDACPVRTMQGVFVMEPTCGGAIEVWALPTATRGKNSHLRRITVHGELPIPALFKQLAKPNQKHHPEEMKAWDSFRKTPSPKSTPRRSRAKTSLSSPASPA